MRKCNICGKRFKLLAKNRYEVVRKPVGFNCLTEGTIYYNAFDCPHCGCQNIVGVLEKVIEADKGVLEKINEKQDSLKATYKAWDEAIQKDGYIN